MEEDKDMRLMGIGLLLMAIAIIGSILGLISYWVYQLLIK